LLEEVKPLPGELNGLRITVHSTWQRPCLRPHPGLSPALQRPQAAAGHASSLAMNAADPTGRPTLSAFPQTSGGSPSRITLALPVCLVARQARIGARRLVDHLERRHDRLSAALRLT